MKNVLAVIGTILIVAACAYGIYKQIDDFNKGYEDNYAYVSHESKTLI